MAAVATFSFVCANTRIAIMLRGKTLANIHTNTITNINTGAGTHIDMNINTTINASANIKINIDTPEFVLVVILIIMRWIIMIVFL